MQDEDGDADPIRALPMDGVLDLHAFRPRDIADLVPTWLDACREHGLRDLRIVHGKGRGVQRAAVHAILARRADVESYALAPGSRGGWGATLVTLRQACLRVSAQLDRPTLEFGVSAGEFTLLAQQRVTAPCAEVFAFLADARNLPALTPPFVKLVTRAPRELRAGARSEHRGRVRGLPLRCRSEITVWEPPTRFVEQQLRDGSPRWRYEHRCEQQDTHTLVRDELVYRVPGGRIVHALLVRPELRRIFAYRQARLEAHFGAITSE